MNGSSVRRYVEVQDPLDPGRTISEIDRIEDGVLWEEKSAVFANDPVTWTERHITRKFARYLEMRRHLPGLEEAPIGFDFLVSPDEELRAVVEAAVSTLRLQHPQVTIHLRYSS